MKIFDTQRIRAYQILSVLLYVFAFAACRETICESGYGETVESEIRIFIDDTPLSKSAAGPEESLDGYENNIRNLCIFRFCNDTDGTARLEQSLYFDLKAGDSPKVSGISGREYTFYALANCGDMSATVAAGEGTEVMAELCYSPGGLPSAERGMAMSCGPLTQRLEAGRPLVLKFTRLAARFDFGIVSSLEHGSFVPENLVLRQSPSSTYLFNKAGNVLSPSHKDWSCDGDSASADELEKLLSGVKLRFYTFGNACGKLIDNPAQDPDMKIPESGSGIDGFLPTFLELTGTYTDTSGELVCHNTYRMFLGRNNYDDFDVIAGSRYGITLNLSDEGGFPDSWWKLEPLVTDSRQFRFVTRSCYIEADSRFPVKVSGEKPEYGISYTLEGGLTGVEFDSSGLSLHNGRNASMRKGWLIARYWDGRIADSCRVVAYPYKAPLEIRPIGIEEIQTEWDIRNFTYIHDPRCTIDHGSHDPQCTDNHIAPWEDDYVDIDYCPHRIMPAKDCPNRTLVPSGSGDVSISFCIATNYNVSSDKRLHYEILTPDSDYRIVSANLQDINGNEYPDDVQYKDPEYEGNRVCLGARFQSAERTHWHIRIEPLKEGLDGMPREYIVSSGGSAQLVFPECSMKIPATYDTRCYMPQCNPEDSRLWFISDTTMVKFDNTDDPSMKDSFHDGEEMISLLKNGAAGKETMVYALNMNGAVISAMPFKTDDYSCDIYSHGHVSEPESMSLLHLRFYTGFRDCTLPVGVYDTYLEAVSGSRKEIFSIRGNELDLISEGHDVSIGLRSQETYDSYLWNVEVELDWSNASHLTIGTDGSWVLR